MTLIEKLQYLREQTGEAETTGLSDDLVLKFSKTHSELPEAIEEAYELFQGYQAEWGDFFRQSERDMIAALQADYVNFYNEHAVNPYVSLSARGPWVITMHGAVIHDSGGYGMLGFGHGPKPVLAAMNRNQVMANVMTANLSQKRLADALRKEIGHRRSAENRHPYDRFLCLNSGSEAVTVAARISDLNAKKLTDPGQAYAGKTIKMLSLKGGFHGRTDRPAQASDSTRKAYQVLASFRDRDVLETVEPNNIEQLRQVFADAKKKNVFFEMMFVEPVMGEGNPGVAMSREFYDEARRLTLDMGSLLLVDSIQAGLRAQGCLSLTDYPGFEDCVPPDLETYSKAVNAGQYPLSILAMSERASHLYVRGVYGNTMTTNPRALDVACAVLDMITDDVRKNIVVRGQQFLSKFRQLQAEFPDVITGVTGTGLLCALHLREEGYTVVGVNCVEKYMRQKGIGVIHGGKNALRFTPHFRIDEAEINLICDAIREALRRGPVYR